jgi:pantoate--beta-alanine ligase
MSRSPMIARTVSVLHRAVDGFRSRKATVALVSTFGARHDGHVSLIRLEKRFAEKVTVSIFVDPTQFAPREDFGSSPRTWKADVEKLTAEAADLIWHPDVTADLDLGVKVIGAKISRWIISNSATPRRWHRSPH